MQPQVVEMEWCSGRSPRQWVQLSLPCLRLQDPWHQSVLVVQQKNLFQRNRLRRLALLEQQVVVVLLAD
jgi:hypothetical protein